MTTSIEIENVEKLYGSVKALKGISLSVGDNEFFTLLGPSGCGKTTLLRCIAGFEEVSRGDIKLFGTSIAKLAPNRRPINTVFQQYALFPHISVIENVAFGLKMKNIASEARLKRAGEMLELVHLSEYANRLPGHLSGGQQQRVALARALAPQPKLLLLDEPLSALDLKLRQAMRVELKQLQEQTGIAFIFVTHDQEEALTMSDRIAVMSDGLVQQIGTARDIYEAPANRFVADFIGEINLLPIEALHVHDNQTVAVLPGGRQITCPGSNIPADSIEYISIRPERISIVDAGADVDVRIDRIFYLGTDLQLIGKMENGTEMHVRLQNSGAVDVPEIGTRVGLKFEEGAARLIAQ